MLLYPPTTRPTSPPLGIAVLKAYLQEKGHKVICRDLNISLFNSFEKHTFSSENKEYIREGFSVFTGKDPHQFHQKDLYSEIARMFLDFEESVRLQLTKQSEIYLESSHIDQGSALALYRNELLTTQKDILSNASSVGISIVFKQQLPMAKAAAKLIKETYNIPVIFGGPGIDDGEALLEETRPWVDFIIYGEAELAMDTLLTHLKNPEKHPLSAIPNLIYMENGTVSNTPSQWIKDICSIPFPDFLDFPLERYYCPELVLPIIVGRGCPWKRCAFCTHFKNYSDEYRFKTIDYLEKEIRHLKETYSCRLFSFIDEMMPSKILKDTAAMLTGSQLDISYIALAKPTKDFTPDILTACAESGCKAILWGVESGTQRILDLIDKGTIVEDIEKVLKTSSQAGIHNYVYMMIGFPTQTMEEVRADMTFLERNRAYIDSVLRGTFYFHPASKIAKDPQKYAITSFDGSNYEVSEGLSKAEAADAFKRYLPHLRSFSRVSNYSNNYRDHMLCYYASHDDYVKNNPLKDQTLAICMIAKDEEKYIGKALECLKGTVDEIILVDTGSQDRTKEIAASYGAKVYDYPWQRDFSKARNFSLSKATADWVFAMDADEALARRDIDRLKALIKDLCYCKAGVQITSRNYIENPHVSRWTPCKGEYPEYEITAGWMPSEKVRLIPNHHGIEFENPVHELLEPCLRKKGFPLVISDIPIHHFGSLINSPRALKKKEYYLDIGHKKIEEYPDSAKAHFELGVQYNVSGFPGKAEHYFLKAIELDPYFPETYFNLGYVYIVLEQYEDAVKILEKHLTFDRSNPHTFVNVGLSYQRLGHFEKAVKNLATAIELNPSMLIAYINLAISQMCLKQYAQAKKCLAQALKIDPNYSETYVTLGSIYLEEQNFPEAEKSLVKAIQVNPKETRAYKHLGTCHWMWGKNFSKAVRYWEHYCSIEANDKEIPIIKKKAESIRYMLNV